MWIDAVGVLHTVALPDPTNVMTDEFRSSLDALAASQGASLRAVVDEAQARIFERDWSGLLRSQDDLTAVSPPRELLRGDISDLQDFADAITRVEAEWRLDAVLALDDYID